MKEILQIILMSIVVAIIISCRQQKPEEYIETEDSIIFNIDNNQNISSLVDTVTYIPLQESEHHIFPEVSKICNPDGYIVIGSKKLAKLAVYTDNGQFLYEIDNRGHGNGEYLEIANFTTTNNIIYIIDNYQHSIHKYSLNDGSYIATDRIPFIAWDMEAFDDGDFLFTMIRNNKEAKFDIDQDIDYAVWKTNGNWEIQKYYLPIPADYVEMYGKQRYFTKNGDAILYHTLKDNGYYRFRKLENPHFIPFELNNPLPSGYEGSLEDAAANNFEYITETPFESDGFLITSMSTGNLEEQYLYDVGQKQFFGNPTENAHNGFIKIVGVLKSAPIGYISDFDMYQSLVNYGFAKADSITEKVLENGGASLVCYKMKKTLTE